MKINRRITAMLIVPASVVCMAATATAASAASIAPPPPQPLTGTVCGSNSNGTFDDCTTVTGGGLQITSITAGVSAANPTPNVHVEFTGPAGLITNTANFTLDLTGKNFTWHNPTPNTNRPAGNYCTITWQLAGGTQHLLDQSCVGVHA